MKYENIMNSQIGRLVEFTPMDVTLRQSGFVLDDAPTFSSHFRINAIAREREMIRFDGDTPKFITADIHIGAVIKDRVPLDFSHSYRLEYNYRRHSVDEYEADMFENLSHHISIRINLSAINLNNFLIAYSGSRLEAVFLKIPFLKNEYSKSSYFEMDDHHFNNDEFRFEDFFLEGFTFKFVK